MTVIALLLALSSLRFEPGPSTPLRAGVASWYEPKLAHVRMWGTRDLVAHRTLRPGTRLTVLGDDGRRVTVIVCGTGPFVRGRDLDLSGHAFAQLASRGRGVIRVRWKVQ